MTKALVVSTLDFEQGRHEGRPLRVDYQPLLADRCVRPSLFQIHVDHLSEGPVLRAGTKAGPYREMLEIATFLRERQRSQ